MRSILILSVLALTIFSCATRRKFVAKTALIKPWSNEIARTIPSNEPYVARFKKGQTSLTYVAANHQYGIASDLFKTIENAILMYKPQMIIVEGISNLNDEKRRIIENRAYLCASDLFEKCGENLFGVYLAKRNGLNWTSAEPTENLLQKRLIEQNYTKVDIAFFYLARQIAQLLTERNLNDNNFDVVANETLADFAKSYALPAGLTSKMFLAWYLEKLHKPFVLSESDSEDTAPTVDPAMTYLNQISAAIGKIRDETIIQAIMENLNSYNSVLVIYGGSHFLTQLDALVDMLGEPAISR